MTHTLLSERGWVIVVFRTIQTALTSCFAISWDVNLLPAQCYQVSKKAEGDEIVHVRALVVVKNCLYTLSPDKSIRLSLKISEFVKPRGLQIQRDDGRVIYTDQWRCNLEICAWSETSAVPSDAELSRLPESILVRVVGFLTVSDFCRVTQMCKYLHLLHDSSELRQRLLLRDYRVLQCGGDPKGQYISHWTYKKRMKIWNEYVCERGYMLRQQGHWQSGGRLPAPPSLFVPPSNNSLSLRPHRRYGLLDDDDLELPFAFAFDPLYPNFY